MTAQDYFDLISIEVFTLFFGVNLFAWCAGYAAGHVLGFTRKITHMST